MVAKVVLTLFLLSACAGTCIDFWHEGCRGKPVLKKQKKKPDKRKVLEDLYKKSLNWTPDDLSPLEKYVSLHPEDEEAVYYLRKYLAKRQIRACYLERRLALLPVDYCKNMEKVWKEWAEGIRPDKHSKQTEDKGLKNYRFLFFFSYTCPHCQKVLPQVTEKLKNYDFVPIPAVQENAEKFSEWKVETVPTLIAVNRKKKKAYRLTGFDGETLEYFLEELEQNSLD